LTGAVGALVKRALVKRALVKTRAPTIACRLYSNNTTYNKTIPTSCLVAAIATIAAATIPASTATIPAATIPASTATIPASCLATHP